MKKTLLVIIVALIVINVPPLNWILGQEDLFYSNSNGSFTFNELNYTGRNYDLCIDNFEAYKEAHKEDTILYRITPINIFKFWLWSDYIFKTKYKLPYKSWDEIENLRGPIKNKTNWQAF